MLDDNLVAEEKQAAQAMEGPFNVSEMIFQENEGSSTLSRWVATYYGPLFESNVFKISVVSWSNCTEIEKSDFGFDGIHHLPPVPFYIRTTI